MSVINTPIKGVLEVSREDLVMQERAALENPGASQAAKAREALEGLLDAFTNPECGEVDRKLAVKDARAALASLPQEPAPSVEVWNGSRKVTVYPPNTVLRVWGPNIDTEMSEEPFSLKSVNDAFQWLFASLPQEPARTQAQIETLRLLKDSEMEAIFLEAIGFEKGELQEVNFNDLKNIAQRIEARALAQNPPPAQEPASQEAVPAGWKLAPVEPTLEMREAFHAVTDSEALRLGMAGSRWAAMLAAAPQPPAASVKQSLTVEQAVPLTRQQIKAAMLAADWPPSLVAPMVETKLVQFARAVEAAHGITAPEGGQQ